MKDKLHLGRYDYAGYLGYIFYACSAMVLSMVLYFIAEDLGFPLNDGNWGAAGNLHFMRSMMIPLTMLACIFLTGRYGKRICLGIALLVMGFGIALAACSGNYAFLAGAILVSAIGQGGFDSIITPFIQTLHEKEDPTRYTNVTHAFWSVGVVSCVLIAGGAIGMGCPWRAILLCLGIMTLLPGILFLLPSRRQSFQELPQKSLRQVLKQIIQTLKNPPFWLFLFCMFLTGGAEHCLSFWCPTYILGQFGKEGFFCGLGTAFYALGMVTGRMGSGILGNRKRMFRIVLWCSIMALFTGIALPLVQNLWIFYLLLFIVGIASGPLWPSIQNYCVDDLEGERTTMLMLLPAIGNPGCGFFTWLLGITADRWGANSGFYLIPACYLLLVLATIATTLLSRKQTGE